MTKAQVTYIQEVASYYKTAWKETVEKMDTFELAVWLGFVIAQLDAQIPSSLEGIIDVVNTFRPAYEPLRAEALAKHPELKISDDDVLFILPEIPGLTIRPDRRKFLDSDES